MEKIPIPRITLSLVIVLLLAYVVLIEPYDLQVTENSFDLFNSTDDVKIVFIADIHDAYNHPSYFQNVLNSINAQDADLILIGGDIVDSIGADWSKFDSLSGLNGEYGAYAILGNHDYLPSNCNNLNESCADEIEIQLEKRGIDVLRNENRIINIKDNEFALIGVDDHWAQQDNYTKASAGIPDEMSKVIIAHNQFSVIDESIEGRNLILSGHTHCGQIRLPFATDYFFKITGFADVVGGRAAISENTELYVTCGVLPGSIRLFAPPEVSVIYLE